MRIIEPSYEILSPKPFDGMAILRHIERCGRVCYKSEDRITDESAPKFVEAVIKRGHESVIEHASITVLFIVDRGVSHELVRHRLCAFSQESTRYVNYGKAGECTFIRPMWWRAGPLGELEKAWCAWRLSMAKAEETYLELLRLGATPQQARSVLPNSTKTEVVVTANLREWRHIFRLRTAKDAHPQMRQVMIPLAKELTEKLPEVFSGFALE